MNKEDLREISSHLEALDSLAKLFNNLWFSQIKKEVVDEKVKAYLLVFEDAFPAMNHVVEYVRRSSELLSSGHLEELQKEFENLSRKLLNRDVDIIGNSVDKEESPGEFEGQESIESLFDNQDSGPGEDLASGEDLEGLLNKHSRVGADLAEDNVDSLLSPEESKEEDLSALWDEDPNEGEEEEEEEEIGEAEDDLDALLDAEAEEEDTGEAEDDLDALLEAEAEEEDTGEAEDDLDALLEAEAEEEDTGEAEVDFDALLDAEAEEEDSEEELVEDELEGLFEEESSDSIEDDDLDPDEVIDGGEDEASEEEGIGISDDEMAALLDEEEEEETPKRPKKGPPKAAAKKKVKNKKNKKPDRGNEDEGINQDEIDALFG